MDHIGHLGSSMLLLPASLVLIALLAWTGRRRDGSALAAALAVCVVATLVAKLGFRTCSFGPSAIESPSGHSSFSAMFYGCCALMAGGGRPLMQRLATYVIVAGLVAAIGVSRVLVYAHSWSEVAVGTAIGLVPVLVFAALRGAPTRIIIPRRALLVLGPTALACALAILLVARQWTPEPIIERAAIHLDALLRVCS